MDKLRVGIISANWGAVAHLPAWRAVPGVEVVGLCTSRRETAEPAAQRFGVARAYWDALEMAADPGIDIVDCGTRPSVRHAMVLAALRHKKPVYNGIPFAADFERARELHRAWRASGSVAIVDAIGEWIPAHRLAKELLESGELGRPFAGTCMFDLSLFNRPNPQFPYAWFAQKGMGVSAVRNLGSHALHTLLYLFGAIEAVVAYEGQLLDEWRYPDGAVIKPETNDFANALLRFASGMTMQLQVSWSATLGRGWMLEAFGSHGRLVAASPSFPTARDTTLHAGNLSGRAFDKVDIPERFLRSPDIGIDADVRMPPAYPMALAMHDMVAAIRGDAVARPDFEQAWQVERVQEAIRRSAVERRWVELAEVSA
jgi:predicted dehydrogenase